LVIGIVVVGGVLVGLGIAAGAVASTGVGAVLEGIAAGIVLALAAVGVITSAAQIIAGIKTLMKFYEATRVAQTHEDLETAGKDFAAGIAEVGVGTLLMILSVLGARQGLKMGKGAANRWNAGKSIPEEPPPPRPAPPEQPKPAAAPAPIKRPSYIHGASDGGPGKWGPASTGRNTLGVEYQQKVTGAPPGTEYQVPAKFRKSGVVDFDGYDPQRGVLLEAKGLSDWPVKEPDFLRQRGIQQLVQQAGDQITAAQGKPIEWHVPTPEKASEILNIFDDANIKGINVVVTPF